MFLFLRLQKFFYKFIGEIKKGDKMDLSTASTRDFERILIRFLDTEDNWLQSFIRYYGAFNILESDCLLRLEAAIFKTAITYGFEKNRRLRANSSARSLAHKCVYRFREIMQETKDMAEVIHQRPYELDYKLSEQLTIFN